MVTFRDILVDISPIIFLIIVFVLKLVDEDKKLLFILWICLFSGYNIYIFKIIADGYGHKFPTVISLVIYIIFLIWNRSVFINRKLKIVKILLTLYYALGIIFLLLFIFFKLAGEIIVEYIFDLEGYDYIKFFESIIENDWFKGISIGIIGTVCGGLILDKIKNGKNKKE